MRAGAITAGFALGFLSYVFIESRTRKPSGERRPSLKFISVRPVLVFSLLLAIGGGSIYADQGVPNRFDPSVFIADRETYDTNPHKTKCHMLIESYVAEHQKISRVVVIGDSHAKHGEAVAAAVPHGKSGDVLLITMEGCPTIYGIRRDNGECFDADRKFVDILSRDQTATTPVIIANHWSQYWSGTDTQNYSFVNLDRPDQAATPFSPEQYREHFLSTVCRISKNRPVYVVKPIPEFDFNVPLTRAGKAKGSASSRRNVESFRLLPAQWTIAEDHGSGA